MSKIKIVVTDFVEPDLAWEEQELKQFPQVEFSHYRLKHKPKPEIIEKIRDAEIIVVNMVPMDEEVLTSLRNCRLIIRHGIGYDNVDVPTCTRLGIPLANVPDYCVEEVAEQAVMLIFAAARKLYIQKRVLSESAKRDEWDFADMYPVYQLKGKTLGIVGCGRIGSTVLQMMRGMGMVVRISDPYLTKERLAELGVIHEELHTILKESDVVSIHCLLNDETRNMFSYKEFQLMKKSAILINTARGGIINTDDLVRALQNREIAGAGIDVYTGKEPPSPNYPLFHMENVILTPHVSWYSEESGWSIRYKIMEDIKRYLNHQPPRFVVNPEVLNKLITDDTD